MVRGKRTPPSVGSVQGSRSLAPLLVVAVGAVLRAIYLNQPMRYDESYTALMYVNHEFWDAISNYNLPNNHVLHTALAHGAVGLLGQSPMVLRLPALLGGMAIVFLTWRVGVMLATEGGAVVGAALVAISATEILYSTNARGYTILGAFWMLAVLAGGRVRSGGAPFRDGILLGILLALGMATIPTAMFGIPGLLVWSFWPLRRGSTKEVAAAILATLIALALVTVACYGPVLVMSGWTALVRNEIVSPQSLLETVRRLPEFIKSVMSDWAYGWPMVIAIALGAGLVRALARIRSPLSSLFLSSLAGATLVILAMRRIPIGYGSYPRVWLFMFPIAALLVAEGLALLWGDAARRLHMQFTARLRWGWVAWGALLGVSAIIPIAGRSVLVRRDTGALRSAQEILRDLAKSALSPQSVVYALSPSMPILVYYSLTTDNMVYVDHHLAPDAGASDGWLIVNTGESQTLAVVQAAAAKLRICLQAPRLVRTYIDADLWHGVAVPCSSVTPS